LKNFRLALLAAATFAAGCASLPLIGQFASVNVPSELPLPDTMVLELGGQAGKAMGLGNRLLGALGGESIEQRLGRSLKESAAPLRRDGAEAFKKQLEDAKLFGSVVNQGGMLGISLGVSRWGLAYNAATSGLEPVLDLEATLSAPGVGTIWKASRSVKDLAAPVLAGLSGLNAASLLTKPQNFHDAMAQVAVELSRQLVDDLKKNPPHNP
jgi:hypothetical protein